jgi:hypothetical protein
VHHQAEMAAERVLDDMMTSFLSSMNQQLPQSDSMDQVQSPTPMDQQQYPASLDQMQSAAASLLDSMGQEFISSHRRLSEEEGLTSEEAEEEEPIKERLARRLSEYINILYHPGGIVTIRSFSDTPKSSSDTSTPNLEMGSDTTPNLGMGSENLDSCIYSSYRYGGLDTDCYAAVDRFMFGYRTFGLTFDSFKNEEGSEVLSKEQGSVWSMYRLYSILLAIYALIAILGMCTGLIDLRTFMIGVVMYWCGVMVGFWSLCLVIPVVFLVDRWCGEKEAEEEEEEEVDACGYVKLNDEEEEEPPIVFEGVPVQVV